MKRIRPIWRVGEIVFVVLLYWAFREWMVTHRMIELILTGGGGGMRFDVFMAVFFVCLRLMIFLFLPGHILRWAWLDLVVPRLRR